EGRGAWGEGWPVHRPLIFPLVRQLNIPLVRQLNIPLVRQLNCRTISISILKSRIPLSLY
ncbi:MAG: hypothetical protein KKA28_00675, partial [Planctomycetes bacterium]|nr:hypothetical protein [Planctomycetota bacterium]